jgi:hypothetical protein
MKPFVFVAIILFTINVAAQTNTWYVSAKAGLSMREKPDQSSLVLDKIPYAAKISLSEDGEAIRIKTENLNGVWRKVNYNGKSGYVVDAYLFEVPPPKAGTKTLREYLQQISTAFGDKLVVNTGTTGSEEGGSQLTKQLFSNGSEWHELLGYEYNSMTYFIPGFTMQQAFLLLRLLPEFSDYISGEDAYIVTNKTVKKKNREYKYLIEKEDLDDNSWIKKIIISFEEGAIYTFELFQIDDQVVIFYGSGV